MTKADLVSMVYEQNGTDTRVEASQTVDHILAVMKDHLAKGNRLLVTNFGSFEVLDRRRRRGRNPVTGEIISIQPRRTLVFRCSRKLEKQLN